MATQDNGNGLLSKVARFVLNPSLDRVDSDQPGPLQASDNSKLALKRMIERKHYNDAVRKREFDKLRKLRRDPEMSVTGVTVPPSAFQDSWGYSMFEERANTLKKIDEIEAQMSKQWWKGRDANALAATLPASATLDLRGMDSAFATTMPSDMQDDEAGVPTQMGAAVELEEVLQASAEKEAVNTAQTFSGLFPGSLQDVAQSNVATADVTLEEAAIRFANSDDGGAEAVLLAALQAHELPAELIKTWAFALLDIYRATGQQNSFDRMAADYARRFKVVAPQWQAIGPSSGVPGLPALESPAAASAPPDVAADQVYWQSPATLEVAALLPLQVWESAAQAPCWLDWRALKTITTPGGQALAALLARWCELPLKLRMEGAEVLVQLLCKLTPKGDNTVTQFWWQLRLDLLRLLRRPDEFEAVALDFCVTYEISPPSWLAARCQLLPGDAVQRPVGRMPVLVMAATLPGVPPPELAGEVVGDATALLDSLQAGAPAGQPLVISCANLVRVDFPAAGSMLNWLANAQAVGVRIELCDVPPLVAAFFQLIGFSEHAQIITRTY